MSELWPPASAGRGVLQASFMIDVPKREKAKQMKRPRDDDPGNEDHVVPNAPESNVFWAFLHFGRSCPASVRGGCGNRRMVCLGGCLRPSPADDLDTVDEPKTSQPDNVPTTSAPMAADTVFDNIMLLSDSYKACRV